MNTALISGPKGDPLVELWDLHWADGDVVLIVKHPKGIRYTNQVGGNACAHPTVRGFIFPMDASQESDEAHGALFDLLLNTYRHESRIRALKKEINEQLQRLPVPMLLDPMMYEESAEAWLHVILQLPQARGAVQDVVEGVLTWGNSD